MTDPDGMPQVADTELTEGLVTAGTPSVDLLRLHAALRELKSAGHAWDDIVLETLKLLTGLVNAAGAMMFVPTGDDGLRQGPRIISRQALPWLEGRSELLSDAAGRAVTEDRLLNRPLSDVPNIRFVAVPVGSRHGALGVLLKIVDDPIEPLLVAIQLVAAYLDALRPTVGVDRAEDTMPELVRDLLEQADRRSACRMLARRLADRMPGSRILIGWKMAGRKSYRLMAASGVSAVKRRSELRTVAETVMGATAARDASDRQQAEEAVGPARDRLARLMNADRVDAVALAGAAGRPVGVVLCLSSEDAGPIADATEDLARHRHILGAALAAAGGGRRGLSGPFRDSPLIRPVALAAAALVLAAGLALPISYDVRAPVVAEPTVRRFVTVPFDAVLEESLAGKGDLVGAGDLLARLDDRELDLQLQALTADRQQYEKTGDIARARGDAAETQLAALQAARVEIDLDILRRRLGELEIRSPIDGLVVDGDLSHAAGAPVGQGDRLFEIAPLDMMRLEIAVAAEDIRDVRDGGAIEYRLAAYPGRSWAGAVDAVQPRAVVRDGRSVFIAEAIIANADGSVRPGMRGEAKIAAGRRPVAWILFHRPWYAFLAWFY